jgi:hypothetical protein
VPLLPVVGAGVESSVKGSSGKSLILLTFIWFVFVSVLSLLRVAWQLEPDTSRCRHDTGRRPKPKHSSKHECFCVAASTAPSQHLNRLRVFDSVCLQSAHVELKSHMIEVSGVLSNARSWSNQARPPALLATFAQFIAVCLQVHVPKKNMLDNVLALGCQDIESARVW